jgi:hypothetical protein
MNLDREMEEGRGFMTRTLYTLLSKFSCCGFEKMLSTFTATSSPAVRYGIMFSELVWEPGWEARGRETITISIAAKKDRPEGAGADFLLQLKAQYHFTQ